MAGVLPTLQGLQHGKTLSEEEPYLGTLLADFSPTALWESNLGVFRNTPRSRQIIMGGTDQATPKLYQKQSGAISNHGKMYKEAS